MNGNDSRCVRIGCPFAAKMCILGEVGSDAHVVGEIDEAIKVGFEAGEVAVGAVVEKLDVGDLRRVSPSSSPFVEGCLLADMGVFASAVASYRRAFSKLQSTHESAAGVAFWPSLGLL